MVARLVLGAVTATAVANPETWVIGTGGCDGAMVGCVDDVPSEQTLQTVEVHHEGDLVAVGKGLPTGGNPVWLATSGDCMFAALADKDKILPVSRQSGPQEAQETGGVAPVHMTVTKNGKYLLAANYHGPDDATTSDGAGVSSQEIGEDCTLRNVDFVPHAGSGPDKSRQGGAHVHSVYASRDGRLAYACDLGQDLIFTYAVGEDGKLTEVGRASTAPGAGPRHLAEHPHLDFVYSVHEMEQSVAAWQKNEDGTLELKQTLSLVNGAKNDDSKAAEIVISKNGRNLYATNRGVLNTVTAFSVGEDGAIAQIQQVTVGRFPRGMALAQDDTELLVASQEDTTLESWHVAGDGFLQHRHGHTLIADGLPNHPATMVQFSMGQSVTV